ncbi:MAG: diguanylate cyclase [Cyanobacteria bacterium P01_H01_bin.21]
MARYALVIGISEYESKYLQLLSKTVVGADAIADLLRQYGQCERIQVLKGYVSNKQLAEALITLITKQADKNEVFIYFTGHSIAVKGCLGDDTGYLTTSDCHIVLENGLPTNQTNAISFSELNNLLCKSQLSNLVMLLDTCHSGKFIEREILEKSFSAFKAKQDYFLITACRGYEKAWAKKQENHSVFTGAVIQALALENADADGLITGDRLFDSLRLSLKDSRQEPVRFGIGRSLPLLRFPAKPQRDVCHEECPYQGLKSFTSQTKEFFFGREAEIIEIADKLSKFNFVPVIGTSGSGKSSLVLAGLIPYLESQHWQILDPIYPGPEPLNELKRAFRSLFGKHEINDIYQHVNNHNIEGILEKLSGEKYLLIIDQFEEIFTLCRSQKDRDRFVQLLMSVNKIFQAKMKIVSTMRADFLDAWLAHGQSAKIIQNQSFFLDVLSGNSLQKAIIEPAQKQGYKLQKELLYLIQNDVNEEQNCLPLLEFALTELWKDRDLDKRLLTFSSYLTMGRLKGALNQHAEAVYSSFSSTQMDLAKRIFLRLIKTDIDLKDTRWRQSKASLLSIEKGSNAKQELNEVLDALVNARLISVGKNGLVDLTHEALMDGWERLKKWRKENPKVRRLAYQIENEFQLWEEGKSSEYLLTGRLLAEARENWEHICSFVSNDVIQFYEESCINSQERGLDYVTELSNRRSYETYIKKEWQKLFQEKLPLSLILLDLDYFKEYTDHHGYLFGEQCLNQIGEIFTSLHRTENNYVAHFGGGFFAICKSDAATEEAHATALLIQQKLAELNIQNDMSDISEKFTFTIGIATIVPSTAICTEDFFRAAELALSHSKQQGRDRIYVHAHYCFTDSAEN